MNYIAQVGGVTVFDEYFEYLESIKNSLPAHVYEFASDYGHYNLTDHSSLHDAWLNSLNIIEPSSGERNENRRIEIIANFLGPFHDREIVLRYLNVQSFNLQTPSESESSRKSQLGHGDLLIHEVRFENQLIVHELNFLRGSTFIIECKDLIHSENILEKNH